MWVLIPVVSIICGAAVSIADKAFKASNNRGNRKGDIKMLDNIHVIEMRMQDLEVQLKEANDKIMRLEEKKYKEIN